MSLPDALVHMELERQNLPFSYRYFKTEWCPGLVELFREQPNPWTPEFTLPQYKTVIIIIGFYFGSIPGIIDANALGKVFLESQGWKVVIWFQNEIEGSPGPTGLLARDLPNLLKGKIHGPPIANPYGLPNFLSGLRSHRAHNKKLITKTRETRTSGHLKRRVAHRRRRSSVRRTND